MQRNVCIINATFFLCTSTSGTIPLAKYLGSVKRSFLIAVKPASAVHEYELGGRGRVSRAVLGAHHDERLAHFLARLGGLNQARGSNSV